MARIFYKPNGEIYGVHPDGNIEVPADVAFIDVSESPDQIAWPFLPDGSSGSEHTSSVNPGTKVLEVALAKIPPPAADRAEAALRDSPVLLALARLASGNDALTEDQAVVLLRGKLP